MENGTVQLGSPYRNLAQPVKKWPSPLCLSAHEQRKTGVLFSIPRRRLTSEIRPASGQGPERELPGS
jgi:hypothetical protein